MKLVLLVLVGLILSSCASKQLSGNCELFDRECQVKQMRDRQVSK